MDELSERILNAALELAERNGYEAVRMRDLAEKAEVALGTVYRRFASKEEVLAGLLEREAIQLEAGLRDQLLPGTTPAERLDVFFQLATMGLLMRPKLARAMLRTVASGEPELAQKRASHPDAAVAKRHALFLAAEEHDLAHRECPSALE